MEGKNTQTQQQQQTSNNLVVLINSAQGIIYVSKYFNSAEVYVKKASAPLVEWDVFVGSADDLREALNRFDYELEIVSPQEMKNMLVYLAKLVED
jgi:hypothetical protein